MTARPCTPLPSDLNEGEHPWPPCPAPTTDQPSWTSRASQPALLDDARARRGRAGHTLTPGAGAPLKQTLLALTAGSVLAEHESPGVVTLQVLTGSVRVNAGDRDIELGTGGYTAIPPTRHSVTSLADAVVLITVAHTEGTR